MLPGVKDSNLYYAKTHDSLEIYFDGTVQEVVLSFLALQFHSEQESHDHCQNWM